MKNVSKMETENEIGIDNDDGMMLGWMSTKNLVLFQTLFILFSFFFVVSHCEWSTLCTIIETTTTMRLIITIPGRVFCFVGWWNESCMLFVMWWDDKVDGGPLLLIILWWDDDESGVRIQVVWVGFLLKWDVEWKRKKRVLLLHILQVAIF